MKIQKVVVLILLMLIYACTDPSEDVKKETDPTDQNASKESWTDSTHGNDVSPNFAIVFPDKKVSTISLKISSENWQKMKSDLSNNMSNSGGQPGPPTEFDFTPIWVPCTIEFEGKVWNFVGIRFKGNSTLRNAYNSNTNKFPFKLDFDEFEDDYPDIKNQRFYGFKQLNLSNNDQDASYMREKIAGQMFRDFGVRAPHAALYKVYLDNGSGSTLLGVYTLVEEVDDTLPQDQFDEGNGNLYKPDGTGASFALGQFNTDDMDLKSGEMDDYADVQKLYDVLHSTKRIENQVEWMSDLESVFNIEAYLKYLAVNTVIQNWDTYGVMTHNYFLYNHDGKLVWIPWDNNESLQSGKMGGALSLSMSEVTDNWPLIRYVMDVPSYKQMYNENIGRFTSDLFTSAKFAMMTDDFTEQLQEADVDLSQSFETAISDLKQHVAIREQAVSEYLK